MQDRPILYINLDRSVDRRKAMEAQFASLGVDAIRIAGVDGIRDQHLADYPKTSRILSWLCDGRQLSKGEIGCFGSHIRAARYIVENKLDWALVLEDDVQIDAAVLSRILELEKQTKHLEYVSLVTSMPKGSFYNFQTDQGPSDVFRLIGQRSLTMAQIIRAGAARKLASVTTVSFPADRFYLLEGLLGVESFLVHPNVIELHEQDFMSSEINRIDVEEGFGIARLTRLRSSLWSVLVRKPLFALAALRMRANNRKYKLQFYKAGRLEQGA